MRPRIKNILLSLTLLAWAGAATAQSDGHIHLSASSADEAVQWYARHFSGTPIKFNGNPNMPVNSVLFGSMEIVFFEREPTGGSVGTGLDHIGFSASNVDQIAAAIAADGGRKLGDTIVFNGMDIAFVEDPWGTKIELINDGELRGFHHLHLSVPDPAETLGWFTVAFSGQITQFAGAVPAIKYGQIWLMASPSEGPVEPTEGRSLDHLGWNVPDMAAQEQYLNDRGVELSMEPIDYEGFKIAFLEGPNGIRLELVQP